MSHLGIEGKEVGVMDQTLSRLSQFLPKLGTSKQQKGFGDVKSRRGRRDRRR